jgi:hypothetical protein
MKFATSILLSAALAFSAGAQNQQPPATWATVTYLKVPGDKMAQFEDAVSTMNRKVIESRISAGEVTRYVSTRMIMPAGSEAKYNYVSATVQTGLPTLERSRDQLEKDWARAGLKRATYVDRLNTLGVVLVKRELWRNIELLGAVEPGDLIRIDAKKVSNAADYVRNERTYHKPYWAERMKQGALKGWGLFYVSLPAGEDRPYSFVTVQWFKDEKQMYGPAAVPASESWKVTAPGKDPWQINRETIAAGHTATVELGRVWMVLRAAGASSGGN